MHPGLSFVNRERELSEMIKSIVVNLFRVKNELQHRVLVSAQHLGSGKTQLCTELCTRLAQLTSHEKGRYIAKFNKKYKQDVKVEALSVFQNVKHIYIDLRVYGILFHGDDENTSLNKTLVFIVLNAILHEIGDQDLLHQYQNMKASSIDLANVCAVFETKHPGSLIIIHLDEIDQILQTGPKKEDVIPVDKHNTRFHQLLVALVAIANTTHTVYLSGRSPTIFKLGLHLTQAIEDSATTPDVFKIVSLVLDSLNSGFIGKLLPPEFVTSWSKHFTDHTAPFTFLEYIFMRTGGVPRLITFAYLYLSGDTETLRKVAPVDVLGADFVAYLLRDVSGAKEVLSFTSLSDADLHTYFRLAEWSYFQLPLKLAGEFDLSVIGGSGEVSLPELLRRWQVYMEKADDTDVQNDEDNTDTQNDEDTTDTQNDEDTTDAQNDDYSGETTFVRLVFPAVVLDCAASHPSYTKETSGTLLVNLRQQFNSSGYLWSSSLAVELLPVKSFARHFCLPIGSNTLGDHFPFFKGSKFEAAEMTPLQGYRMPKFVKSQHSGGAKILRYNPATEPLTPIELAKIKEKNDLTWLKEFFTAPSGSKSTNINYADMELVRSFAPMNGFFIPVERSKSADSWIRWQALLRMFELFIQSKSHQKITPDLIKEELEKIKFPLDPNISACLLVVSLNDQVSLAKSTFEPVIHDGNIIAYRIPAGGRLSYTATKTSPNVENQETDANKTTQRKGKNASAPANVENQETDPNNTTRRKRKSAAAPAAPATPTKKVKSEEHIQLADNVEVIVLTGKGAGKLLTPDTFSFMTKNLHQPPPVARLPSILDVDQQEDADAEGEDEDAEGEDADADADEDEDEEGEDDKE